MNMMTKRRAPLFVCLLFMTLYGTGALAMNKKISVVIVGFGRVGQAVQKKLTGNSNFIIRGLFTSKWYRIFNEEGALKAEVTHASTSAVTDKVVELIANLPKPFIVVDTSSNADTFSLLKKTLARGGYVVTANKKHFSQEQAKFDELHALGADRLFYSTTVGAGLPIIQTIKKLVAQHAEISSIKGILSGTLGFVFSEIDKGTSFSHAVAAAYDCGLTEPHPKDDLSGMDVARKLMIMARVMGIKLEPSAVNISSLYSPDMEKLSPKDFVDSLATKGKSFTGTSGKRMRYLGSIIKTGKGYKLETAVEEVDKTSPFFDASGPENIIVLEICGQTTPLVIRGAGAGVEVTAERLCEDLFTIKSRL
jgi:homoserine dehydrogenase